MFDIWTPRRIRFFAPQVAFEDAEKYLPPLFAKRGKPVPDVSAALAWLRTVIEPVAPELYTIFEDEARERIEDRDEMTGRLSRRRWPFLLPFGRRIPISSAQG